MTFPYAHQPTKKNISKDDEFLCLTYHGFCIFHLDIDKCHLK